MASALDGLIELSKSDIGPAVDLLTHAFWDDPLCVHFFPNEDERKKLLPVFFKFRLKQPLQYGEVYATSSRLEGVAAWQHSNTLDGTFWKYLRAGGLGFYRTMGRTLVNQMMKMNQFTNQRREKYAAIPHMHLSLVAVNPELQGQGYTSKLIRPMLERLDRLELPCYLEAQSESNVSIYEHYGFEVLAKGCVPTADIPHWDMMRHPQ
jgi:ribosomal protein S18 acetylase RimI-like enzyme